MTEKADAYQEGYIAGYGDGTTDGRSQGYSDAKYRAFVAFETVKDSLGPSVSGTIGKLRDALVGLLGSQ